MGPSETGAAQVPLPACVKEAKSTIYKGEEKRALRRMRLCCQRLGLEAARSGEDSTALAEEGRTGCLLLVRHM